LTPEERRIFQMPAPASYHGVKLAAVIASFILARKGGSSTNVKENSGPHTSVTKAAAYARAGLLLAAPILLAAAPSGRVPKSDGRWQGAPGNGIWKPNKPIILNDGTKITEVRYRDGMPVFDKWSKGEVKIAITGNHKFDRAQAIRAWHAHGGGALTEDFVFHHDGLMTETIKYKGKNVLVGRMQLVPADLNRRLPHIGAASMARRIFDSNIELAKHLANEVNQLALKDKGPLMKVGKRFKSVLAKGIKKAGRLVPIVGGVLVILDFAENVEVHGIGGALLRSTPLLGDIVTIYDVGRDLAQSIKNEAAESVKENLSEVNENARNAHVAAAAMTVRAFEKLSKQLRVSNPYFEAQSLKEPLENYYETTRILILLKSEGKQIQYPPDATPTEKAAATSFDLKMRRAQEELEREIRQQTEKPATDEPRGPIG
jgi:hypothetical protein